MTARQDPTADYTFKLVLVGDSGVGKSNLLCRFTKNEFNPSMKSTIGVEFAARVLQINGRRLKASVWDTAGQERYRAITSSYYRGAVGALLVFDITKPKSFQNLSKWLEELGNHADPATIIGIIGNKSDLESQRRVSFQEAQDFANLNRLFYFETSAKDSKNVDEAFTTVMTEAYKTMVRKGLIRDDSLAESVGRAAPAAAGSSSPRSGGGVAGVQNGVAIPGNGGNNMVDLKDGQDQSKRSCCS